MTAKPFPQYIDSHVHLDIILAENPKMIAWFKEVGCLPISWSYTDNIESVADLSYYLQFQQKTIHDIRKMGLSCFYLTGVHPRNIPSDLRPSKITAMLEPYLSDPHCLGLGEIGLETATNREKEILIAQLELARPLRLKNQILGIHTPHDNKRAVTEKLLKLLKQYRAYHKNIIIDHCDRGTIDDVLAQGYWAGISLSPHKMRFGELNTILKKNASYINRIILNSDSGNHFYKELHTYSTQSKTDRSVITQITLENAIQFYQLARSAKTTKKVS